MSRIYADNIDPRNSGDLTVAGIATYNSTGADITGIVTATSFYGDVRPNSLEVSGVTTVSAGSASAPSITPTGDSNTGIFFPSADTIAFGEGGSEALRITSSGNVGIATNNPDALLHLDSTVGAGTSNYLLRLQNRTTTPDSRVGMALLTNFSGGSSAGYGAAIYASNDGASGKAHTIFGTLSSFAFDEHMRIDSSGRLLVGTTTSPSAGQGANSRLVVQGYVGDATDIGIMSIQRGEAAASISSGEAIGRIAFNDNAGNSFAYVEAFADADAGSDDFPGRLVFSTTADGASSPTERLRIGSEGHLYASSASSILSNLTLKNNGSGGDGPDYLQCRDSANTLEFVIEPNGNVKNTNDSYGAISDIKLKENIVDAESQWDDFKAVRFRKYNFKEETGHETFTQLGVIAQELELVSPGLVEETPDLDEEGNDLGTTTKSVKYSILTKKALVALQEAMERIETLETQNTTQATAIADLTARIEALEA